MVILMTSSSSSKTEFTCIFYDVFDVGGYAGSSLLEVSLLSCKAYLLCLFLLTSLCFDATRCLVSNKLEFAQFGAHMKKLWQFCFSPCGSTAVAAVVPLVASSGSTALLPPRFWVCSFRVGFSGSRAAVRHGSTATALLPPYSALSCLLLSHVLLLQR